MRALVTVGRPMTYSTLAICAAFLMLVGSPLDTLSWLGTTASAALALAWLCDFLLTPALRVGIRVVTLWDTLLLDLGPRPRASIPLLADLSTSQCRIFAQMAGVQRVEAGAELSRTGESGREMYLVIAGLLEASVETPMATWCSAVSRAAICSARSASTRRGAPRRSPCSRARTCSGSRSRASSDSTELIH